MQSNSVMTLSNSIIGVSILAMPFCFQQCGIVLSLIILFFTSIISRLACHFLLKSAIISRCRNFEFLAFHIFGPAGKTVIELSIVGFLMGSCVAFFVVVGDLGPAIVKSALNLEMSVQALRPALLIGVAVFIILPLSLVRDIDSLSSVCTVSIGFYIILVLKIILEATPPIFASSWADKVNYWRPAGILQCLPIFSSALSCQTQLFEIFGSSLNGPLDKINGAIKSSVNMCTAVYMGVGLFGYIAFCSQPLTGNALMNIPPSISGDIIKLGFVVSVALSFPLVIFPCRASLYSFLYHQTHSPHYELLTRDTGSSSQKVLTLLIVTISLVLALLVPSIELVLGLLGSTIGVILCYILPSVFFTRLLKKNTNERLLAQVVIIVGVFIMVLGTYVNLFATEEALSGQEKDSSFKFAVPPEKNISPESIEESRKQVLEPFLNEPEKVNPDSVKIIDIKKDSDQAKPPAIKNEPEPEQVKVIDTKKDFEPVKSPDIQKDVEQLKSQEFVKETRKEPLEPVEPVEVKKVAVEAEPLKVDSKPVEKPDVSQDLNKVNLEAPIQKEIIVEKAEVVAEKFPKIEKSAEKQIENPNDNKQLVPPPKVEKQQQQEVPIPPVRKIKKKPSEGPSKLLPLSKKDNVVNGLKSEGNLRPEIIDKLKDTVPLPIALQQNINVFNVSQSHNIDIKKKVAEPVDKILNRDLLQQNKEERLDRERRDVDSSKTELLSDKQSSNKSTDEHPTLVVKSLEPAEQANDDSSSDLRYNRDTANKNIPVEITADKSEDAVHQVEQKLETIENSEKSALLISEMVDVLVGDLPLKLDVKDERVEDLNNAHFVDENAQAERKSNQIVDQLPGDKSEDQSASQKNSEQSVKSDIKLNLLEETPMKSEILKSVLENANSASGGETCPKNKTVAEKSATVINKTTGDQLNLTRLKIQAAGRLSSPDNLLEQLKAVDVEIRDAFQDVAKPLKRDLKSVEIREYVSNELPLDDNLRLSNTLGNKQRKVNEIKDDR